MQTSSFQTGSNYYGRHIGDADLLIKIEVVSRTEKTVKVKLNDTIKSFKVKIHSGHEYIMPYGRYSMAPSVSSERLLN
jgi:hypothetical protein